VFWVRPLRNKGCEPISTGGAPNLLQRQRLNLLRSSRCLAFATKNISKRIAAKIFCVIVKKSFGENTPPVLKVTSVVADRAKSYPPTSAARPRKANQNLVVAADQSAAQCRNTHGEKRF
jgi:hypothetical protein